MTLEVFAAVVDQGSFVAAARALDLSPASVTEHIQALEKRLKTKLLNRTTRRIALTEEGAAYFEHCKQLLARMEEADSMLAAQRSSPKGTLRMQGPQVLVNSILLPRMSQFLERYPELSAELSISAAMPDLVQQNLDLAILINPDPSPGVIFRPIGLCPVRTFASPAYLREHGTPAHPDELANHRVIGVRTSPGVYLSTFRFQQDGRMISRDFPSRVTVDLGDGPAVAAAAGVGIGQSYNYAVAQLIEEGKLVPVLDDWSWSGPPLGAVHLPNRFLSPKVQVFLDFVKEALGNKVSPYRADWDNR
ncbi:MAG: transcriptional regulator [Burkholderiales bacterium]|nr:transcriptional regulator [Burkholderiales bacterium]